MTSTVRWSMAGVAAGALTGGIVIGALDHLEMHRSIVDSFTIGFFFVAGWVVTGTAVVLLRQHFGK